MEALLLDAERALVASALAADQANNNNNNHHHHASKPLVLGNNNHNASTTAAVTSKPPTRGHRSQSQVWKFLTREENPHRATRSTCMHCLQDVPHHRKSEKARAHLLRCEAFRSHMASVADASARPDWFDHEPPRRQTKSKSHKVLTATASKTSGVNGQGGMTVVPAAQPHVKAVDRMPTAAAVSAVSAVSAVAPAAAAAISAPPMMAASVAPALLVVQSRPSPAPVLAAAKRRVEQEMSADRSNNNSNKRQATGLNTSFPSTSVLSNAPRASTLTTSAKNPTAVAKKQKKLAPAPPSSASSHAPTLLLRAATAGHAPELSKLHAALAMFFYSTATPFARIENQHLQKAFTLSNPSVTLPSASQLAGPLLDQALADTQTQVNAALSAFEFNNIVVNGWSSSSSSSGNSTKASASSQQRRVDYVVVNEQHAFLLETSVLDVEQRQDADLLTHKMIGIMNRCGHNISGTFPTILWC